MGLVLTIRANRIENETNLAIPLVLSFIYIKILKTGIKAYFHKIYGRVFVLQNQHSIAEGEETIAFFHGYLIGFENLLAVVKG